MNSATPQILIFDDEPLEAILYGENDGEATPVDVLERSRSTGNPPQEDLDTLIAILSRYPDKAHGLASPLLTRIAVHVEQQQGSGQETDAHQILQLANIHQATGALDKAENCYRRALEGNDLVSPLPSPARSLAMRNLSALYTRQGSDDEALEWRLMGEAERALADTSPWSLFNVRALARDLFVAGRFSAAEKLYRRLLERQFERPGTSTHLARVLLMQDRLSEAMPVIDEAWNMLKNKSVLRETPRYVLQRIVFFGILFSMLQGKSCIRKINRLRRELTKYPERMEWNIEPVINHLRQFLNNDDLIVLDAMNEAINTNRMDKLDAPSCLAVMAGMHCSSAR